jgi:hypothetical protein
MMTRCLYLIFAFISLSACSTGSQTCEALATGDVVYVVDQDWHTNIGIPVEELDGDLRLYRDEFPGARVIVFGYGKKTFFTAPPETISEYFLGPIPGPAVIQIFGLRVMPNDAYAPSDVMTLKLPSGGSKALSEYIWKDLAKDIFGKPVLVAHSTNPDGLFYAAQSEYNFLHTCNTWIASALQQTGLPIDSNAVIFSSQVMARVASVNVEKCQGQTSR